MSLLATNGSKISLYYHQVVLNSKDTIRLLFRVRKITQATFVSVSDTGKRILMFSAFIITDKFHCLGVQVKS